VVINALGILGAICGFMFGPFVIISDWISPLRSSEYPYPTLFSPWVTPALSPDDGYPALYWLGAAIMLFSFGGLVALALREGHRAVAAALLLLAGAIPLAGVIVANVMERALMPAGFIVVGVLAGVLFIAGAMLDIWSTLQERRRAD